MSGNRQSITVNEMSTQRQLVKELYRLHAPWYDSVAAPALGSSFQHEAVSYLRLKPGDVVVDVACGTGSTFTLIKQKIGETGHLIGIDLSPEMLQQARARVVANGLTNVLLINASAKEAQFEKTADAILFSFAHDVLQSSRTLHNLFQHATPGARVAACGIKLAPWWNIPLNYFIYQIAWKYHTVHKGLLQPWSCLERFVSDLKVKVKAFGTIYVAFGTVAINGRAA